MARTTCVKTLPQRREDREWMAGAACVRRDPELWQPLAEPPKSPVERRRIQLAKSICYGCPVREECLIYAIVTGQRYGIWGGMTPRERALDKRCRWLRAELAGTR
jgi:WhiB family transcriptional regulator, redox-sensing transcriptional regulator